MSVIKRSTFVLLRNLSFGEHRKGNENYCPYRPEPPKQITFLGGFYQCAHLRTGIVATYWVNKPD